ncbi:MAG: hypothetical protein JW937_01255 [Candidatus Omnitrophica bacterium]|nr:hypothetical protein [Candidatus Omnitrophota bacterium]
MTLVYGVVLIVLGLGAYFLSGQASFTALIPAFFGLPIAIMGILAGSKPNLRKHLIHASLVLAVLGLAGSARGVFQLPALLSQAEVDRPMAVVTQSIMAGVSLVYVILGVRSFVQARKSQARNPS